MRFGKSQRSGSQTRSAWIWSWFDIVAGEVLAPQVYWFMTHSSGLCFVWSVQDTSRFLLKSCQHVAFPLSLPFIVLVKFRQRLNLVYPDLYFGPGRQIMWQEVNGKIYFPHSLKWPMLAIQWSPSGRLRYHWQGNCRRNYFPFEKLFTLP